LPSERSLIFKIRLGTILVRRANSVAVSRTLSSLRLNQTEGNSAGAGYGVWKGAGRTAARQAAGLVEILTFPFPIWHDSYQPLLPSDIPYIHGGYAEFPPEVGNESKYPYVRDTHHDFN
jgi:putative exosortase-associated protein (TIGR04073 family)